MDSQNLSWHQRKEIIVPALVSVVIAILLVVLPMNWIVMLSCWVVLAICIVYLIIILLDHKLLRILILIVSIILISIEGFYRVQDQWFKDHPQKQIMVPPMPQLPTVSGTPAVEPAEKPPKVKSQPKQPTTEKQEILPVGKESTELPNLEKIFKDDFPNVMKHSLGAEVNTPFGIVKIIEQEYMDFNSKSKFLGFYIPFCSHPYDICEFLAGECENIMKSMEQVKVTGGMVTDSAQTSSDNLIFSGRVYIYYEDDLSLQQLADLERLYKSKGLSVIFRGHAYMALKWFGNKK